MKKTNTLKTHIIMLLALVVFLPALLLVGNIAFVSASETGTYEQVADLSDLEQKIGEGKKDFEITNEIVLSSDKTFTDLNFKYSPETDKYMFKLEGGVNVKFENCKVLGDSKWTVDTTNPENVVVVAEEETIGKQHFVQGHGNLTLENCEFKDIYESGSIVSITGTTDTTDNLTLLNCNFVHCASAGAFVYSNYAIQNWGNEQNTLEANKLTNFYGNNNGSFIQAHHGTVNIYQLRINDVVHVRNGLIAPENATVLNIYNGFYMENAKGFAVPGGTFGSLIHMYDGCDFNMHGGTIKNCSGVEGIICTGRENIKFNLFGGEIECEDETTFLVLENATVYIGEDAVCQGNINCWGYGTLENHGTINGNIVVSDDTVYGTSGQPTFKNEGKVEGTIDLSDGTIENKGSISGQINITGGELTNTEDGQIEGTLDVKGGTLENDGNITGDLVIAEGANAINNGTIVGNVEGKIEGNGKIKAPNSTFPGWAIALICVSVVVILLGAIGVAIFFIQKKKKPTDK